MPAVRRRARRRRLPSDGRQPGAQRTRRAPAHPGDGRHHIRRAEQELAAADSSAGADEARARLEFIRRHVGELMYDLPCHQGHYTLATAPQITKALRRAKGDWVSLSEA